MAAQKQMLVKKKKKKWFTVNAPAFIGGFAVGETPAYEPTELPGRTVTTNLANLLGDAKKQGTYVQLRVTTVDGNTCNTELNSFFLSTGSIKRMVKRGRTKVSDSFVCKTQDDVFVRIKPMLLTNGVVNRLFATRLRKGARLFFKEYCHATSYEHLMGDLIKGILQKNMKEKLMKLYPLRFSEVYMLHKELTTLRETVDEKGTDIVFEKDEEEILDDDAPDVVESAEESAEETLDDEK